MRFEPTLFVESQVFDDFIKTFNEERPHEGIDNKYPSEIYTPSNKELKPLEPLFYPFHDQTITVTQCGRICTKTMKVSLSKAFAGQQVGIKEMEDGIWVVSFLDYDLGYFDDKMRYLRPSRRYPDGRSKRLVYRDLNKSICKSCFS